MSYRVLGVSCAHDSSVTVICDGELEYFGKEERYTGEKRAKQPYIAIQKAIEASKGPIDTAVIQSPTVSPAFFDAFLAFVCKSTGLDPEKVLDFTGDHHLSHAFNAFNNHDFDRALVFVIDRDGSQIWDPGDEPVSINGRGEVGADWIGRECESVYLMELPGAFKELHKAFWMVNPTQPRSETQREKGYEDFVKSMQAKRPGTDLQFESGMGITKVYESATTLIGEGPLENGKTMGLAAYGEPRNYPPLFIGTVPIDQYFVHSDWTVTVSSQRARITNKVTPENHKQYADWAYHVQQETQKALNHLVQKYVNKTGIKKVILTGGYGLNVVANNYLIRNNPDVEFYFEPNADDTGNSMGCAWYLYRNHTQDSNAYPKRDTWYHHIDPQDPVEGESSTPREIASMIAKGRSVALYGGAPEAGPRALGHRSILFDPRNKDAKDIVNRIKKREWYRPFAGIILEEHFDEYFETLGLKSSPNMTVSFVAKEKALQECPGIIHVDGTCRIQTVTSGYMAEVLREFHNETGVPVLLNTSFNLAGKPLVHTTQDALDTLNDSMLDAVYFVQDDSLVR